MGRHSWTNRVFPPLVIAAIIGSVWYAVTHRSDYVTTSAVTSSVPTAPKLVTTPAAPQTTALPVPTIKKISGHVQLSVDTKQVPHVQKVEFYFGNQLVGAAYSSPYSVTFDENNLQPGTHVVTAKVYTPDTTTQTGPTSFTSQQTAATTGNIPAQSASSNTSSPTPAPSTPPAITPDTPSNVTAVLQQDGTVLVSWDASAGSDAAVSYQIWQGTSQIGSSPTTTYTDSTVSPGGTYDYQIVAVDAAGNTSQPSSIAAVTVSATSQQAAGSQNAANASSTDNSSTQ